MVQIEEDGPYLKVTMHGYEGLVFKENGRIGMMMTGKGGSMADATELRRYAEFILELAKTSETVQANNWKRAYDGWCSHHTDMIDKAYYYHVKPLKNGTFTLYQGSYSDRTLCTVGNLERIGNYPTIEAIDERIGDV